MPIKTTYTDDWGKDFNEAVASIKSITYSHDGGTIEVSLDVWGDENEYMNPDFPPRTQENIRIGCNEVSQDGANYGLILIKEAEKILKSLASPISLKVKSKIDYTKGVIDDTLDNTK